MELDLNKIEETPHLLDILLEIEDVIDSLDVYVFKNWMKGEIIEGPIIKRYWVEVTIRYPLDQMPDPRAGLRLLAHGIMVSFEKGPIPNLVNRATGGSEAKEAWFVKIEVPRKLLNGMNDASVDFYDEEIDVDDIESAKDLGVDENTAFTQQEAPE
jgi:hypothetical protein